MTTDAPSIVVLVSGSGSNLQALIDAVHEGRIHGRISAVVSNNPEAYGLERARRAGIPTEVIDHRNYESREAFDRALAERIDRYHPDLVVLAGFMRILTPEFVEHYRGRMLNIHPSLLPKYRGLNTHARAIEAGDSEHGVSVHFVTPELDGGPVIAQARVPVHADDTPERLAARVLEQEHRLYPLVTSWYADGRLRLEGGQVLFDGRPLARPLQLDELEHPA
ncbi:MAG: phosphoribosylglycinamide formyltransferase [Gammaproteobacteria bacterium]|nr:MAG: phosphoribosylglycinamide formyltransferase [Gammaproteobacteria bacterium]